jgi:hypothetical protein
MYKPTAHGVRERSRTKVRWKDNMLAFVDRALILINLNKKGCMNWEAYKRREVFRWYLHTFSAK